MRITFPKLLGAGFAAVLIGYTFVYAPGFPGHAVGHSASGIGSQITSVHPSPAPPEVFPPAGKKFVGVMTSTGPYDFTAVDKFSMAVHQHPSVYEFAQGWALNQFNRGVIDKVANRGMLPLISWEPWDYRDNSPGAQKQGNQPAYKLSNIIDGHYDRYIRSWAEGVKSLGYTIGIRFAHEMNGNWYPWCIYSNGNTVSEYVQAWRHVHDIFTHVGTTNVIWVWSPNIVWNTSKDLAALYPGNSYVDWIGLSGYYGTPGIYEYRSFDSLFDQTLSELRTFTGKPIVITETGGTNTADLMARYVTQMFDQLPAHTNIIGVIWYEATAVIDWKIADHPDAAAAFAKGFANPLYRVTWRRGMVPLETAPQPRTQLTTGPSSSPPPGTATPPTVPTTAAPVTRPPTHSPRPTPAPTSFPSRNPSPSPKPTTSPTASPTPSPTKT